MNLIDAFGMQCPKPLVLAKRELEKNTCELSVQVDNETAVKNLTRLGEKIHRAVSVDVIEGGWLVSFAAVGDTQSIVVQALPLDLAIKHEVKKGCGYTVFIGKDHMGEGDIELGKNLMKMALYTLAESEAIPASLLFMNAGVKLVLGSELQVVESVNTLVEKGTEVLVCGTCLDFYGVKSQLAVGEISNMYDIVGRMQEASKVLTF